MWHLNANEAAFSIQALAGTIDSAAPHRGLQALSWQQQPLREWSLLGVVAPRHRESDRLAIEEQYIRGEDFVVDYGQVAGPNVQPQCYWRLHQSPEHAAAGIEVILSLRTSLLASRPESQLTSSPAAEAELLLIDGETGDLRPLPPTSLTTAKVRPEPSAAGVLLRPKDRDFSYVEFVVPSDCAELELEAIPATKGWQWKYTLFREHLEKGVIRRGRIQSWFLPRKNDEAAASHLRADFLNSPPPLTA